MSSPSDIEARPRAASGEAPPARGSRALALAAAAAVGVALVLAVAAPRRQMQGETKMTAAAASGGKADIIHIVLDDIGMNDLWGSQDLDADVFLPNIKALREGGVELENYYGQAFCTPARATLMTGKFTHRIGFADGKDVESAATLEIDAWANFSLASVATQTYLPERLGDLGYATHGVGKWNLGHCNEAMLPPAKGFDSYLGYYGAGIAYVDHLVEAAGDLSNTFSYGDATYSMIDMQRCDGEGCYSDAATADTYSTSLFTDTMISKVEAADASDPLYLYLAYHGVHDDKQANETGLTIDASTQSALDTLGDLRGVFAMALKAVDDGVGRLQETLADYGRDYVLVLHADNGGSPCGSYCDSSNYPLRGMKFFDFEGGLKVPALVYSPSRLGAGRTYSGLFHHVDWTATFMALAGNSLEGCDDCDSVSHWQALVAGDVDGAKYDVREHVAFSTHATGSALRIRNYKYLKNRSNQTWYALGAELSDCMTASHDTFLFDLDADPYETTNLALDADYAAVVQSFDAEIQRIAADEYVARSLPAGSPTDLDAQLAAWMDTQPTGDTRNLAPWGCTLT